MYKINRFWLGLGALVATIVLSACAMTPESGSRQEKVVYHFNDSANAAAGLNNIKNHLAVSPDAKIVAVTHGKGVDFMIDGATDKDGNPYSVKVEELIAKGVEFRVCNNTLKSRNIDPKTVLPNAKIVPSGVAEIGRLQAQEGYVYLKP